MGRSQTDVRFLFKVVVVVLYCTGWWWNGWTITMNGWTTNKYFQWNWK